MTDNGSVERDSVTPPEERADRAAGEVLRVPGARRGSPGWRMGSAEAASSVGSLWGVWARAGRLGCV